MRNSTSILTCSPVFLQSVMVYKNMLRCPLCAFTLSTVVYTNTDRLAMYVHVGPCAHGYTVTNHPIHHLVQGSVSRGLLHSDTPDLSA